jgi:hypothetical protein
MLANTIDADDLTCTSCWMKHTVANTETDRQTDHRASARLCTTRPPSIVGHIATIAPFETAMQEAEATNRRLRLSSSAVQVQESGWSGHPGPRYPRRAGNFDSVLVRRAARKLKDSTARGEYARSQGLTGHSALVLQTPTRPTGRRWDRTHTIFASIPICAPFRCDMSGDPHTEVWSVGGRRIEPRVQDESHVRVLVAKDAISTGWDCPRRGARVVPAGRDNTHITQLLGHGATRSPHSR